MAKKKVVKKYFRVVKPKATITYDFNELGNPSFMVEDQLKKSTEEVPEDCNLDDVTEDCSLCDNSRLVDFDAIPDEYKDDVKDYVDIRLGYIKESGDLCIKSIIYLCFIGEKIEKIDTAKYIELNSVVLEVV